MLLASTGVQALPAMHRELGPNSAVGGGEPPMRRQTAPDVRLPFLCSSCLHDLAVVCTALRGRQLGRVQKRRAAPCAATATQVAAYRLLLGGRGASDRRPVFATTRRAAVPQRQTDRQASATRQP